MNIWLWNHFAGAPEIGMEYRPYYLSKWLTKKGHKVSIFASTPHHLMITPPEVSEDISTMDIDGINYVWIKAAEYHSNGLRRLLNHFSYAWTLFKNNFCTVSGLEKPDVIIASSPHPFHYLAAKRWATKYNCKLIFEVRDLWPLSLTELLGTPSWHPLVLLLSWIEKYAYRTADRVVSVLPYTFEYMEPRGVSKERFAYVPNGIDLGSVQAGSLESENPTYLEIKELKKKGKFIIGYAGTHGIPNPLEELIGAAGLYQEKYGDDLAVVLVGHGTEKERLIGLCRDGNIRNVYFFDRVPKKDVAPIVSLFDVGYIGFENKEFYKYGVSANKIFEYMGAAKPILISHLTEKNPVTESGGGIQVPPLSPEKLLEAVVELEGMSENDLKDMGGRGYAFLRENHLYERLAEKYIEIIRQI
ncbi:glycosyltransferase family 4 protein [Emcibacter nanhaiensis]|uniref:Glycosyltransferase family 4 protein n=1 Tax=Emcibacter nanhaiensis TaxID=1505037 RepID=A0A501PAK4_9PROT|nr:glycosyltransferase family 4 protein [Emcibacter nanhaiensis]TPD57409.1 glycosyltransferase family 4 protein [Emcibacter nanhaiensis]